MWGKFIKITLKAIERRNSEPAFFLLRKKNEKKIDSFGGTQWIVSKGSGQWHLNAKGIPSSGLLCTPDRKHALDIKVQASLPGLDSLLLYCE